MQCWPNLTPGREQRIWPGLKILIPISELRKSDRTRAADTRARDSRYDVIGPGHTSGSITDKISEIVLTRKTPKGWWIGFGISFLLMNLLLFVASPIC